VTEEKGQISERQQITCVNMRTRYQSCNYTSAACVLILADIDGIFILILGPIYEYRALRIEPTAAAVAAAAITTAAEPPTAVATAAAVTAAAVSAPAAEPATAGKALDTKPEAMI